VGLFYGTVYSTGLYVERMMNYELKSVWKDRIVIVAKSKYYPGTCLEGLRKPPKAAVRIADVAADIRTDHLRNTSLDFCCWV
jgi:hypothetical protein